MEDDTAPWKRTREGLIPIVDTHQHLWDLERLNPPWLSQTPPVMQQSYTIDTYLREARGTGIERAVYMEVDVAVSDRPLERELVAGLCLRPEVPTAAAVFSGSVDSPDFASELAAIRRQESCRGIRHLLHPPTAPPGTLLSDRFAAGLALLADAGLLFDICIRPRELADAVEVARRCPGNTFVVDHCGNADPLVVAGRTGPSDDEVYGHERQQWLDDIAALGAQVNAICKISGIVARGGSGWTAGGPGADRRSLHRLLRRGSHRVRQRLAGVRARQPVGGLGHRAAGDRQPAAGAAAAQRCCTGTPSASTVCRDPRAAGVTEAGASPDPRRAAGRCPRGTCSRRSRPMPPRFGARLPDPRPPRRTRCSPGSPRWPSICARSGCCGRAIREMGQARPRRPRRTTCAGCLTGTDART